VRFVLRNDGLTCEFKWEAKGSCHRGVKELG
jgi:hypothetical protein